jgi:hypothetical protein
MDPIIFAQLNEAYHRGVYSPEETLSEEELIGIEEWVEALIEEGYDLDQYSDEELYEAYMKEAFVSPYKARFPTYNNPHGHSPQMKAHIKSDELRKNEPGSTRQKKQTTRSLQLNRLGKAARDTIREDIDLYDLVSEYLVSEGFCDSYEDADVIMANMSEEWREGIVEEVLDEALTGYRGKRAFTKFQDQNFRPDQYKKPSASKNPSPNYTLGAVGRHKEGSPNPYNPATPEDYRDTGNRPTKRGGRGKRGEAKTGYYGVDKRDSDRGRGNASKRRMGL